MKELTKEDIQKYATKKEQRILEGRPSKEQQINDCYKKIKHYREGIKVAVSNIEVNYTWGDMDDLELELRSALEDVENLIKCRDKIAKLKGIDPDQV